MSANVIQLERIFRRSWDWSSRELGEFYRVESALIQAGLKIDTERGLSDEGDPWFAFCRPDDGEVIVHIARIGGIYILAGPSYDGIASGTDIAALVRDLVSRHPLIQMRGNSPGRSSNIFVHPAALLIAVIATAFFKSTEARALTEEHKPGENRTATGLAGAGRSDNISMLETHKTIIMDAVQSAVILSAVASVLQTPSLFASTTELTDAVAPTSDLLDLAAWSATAHHTLVAETRAAGFETHQFEMTQEVHAQATSGIVPIASVHPAMADPTHVALVEALPLVATLWDLPTNRADIQIVAHHSSDAPAASKGIGPAAVTLQSPQVTFKMALSNEASDSLPSVQATKISYSSTNGATETYNIAKPEQLAATLVSALKETTHTIIEGQPTAAPSASFANALFQSVVDHTLGSKLPDVKAVTASPVDTPQPQTASATAVDKPASQPPATSHATDSQATVSKVTDVTALVQNFFEHTPHWSMYNDGDRVVIYNTDALTLVMKSVTFDFADGSALSLVGLPADLPHLLAT